jgi:hypothetical protein
MRAKFCRFRKQEQQEAPMVCEMHGNSWKEANAAQLLGLNVIVGCRANYTSVSVLQLNFLMHYHIFLGLLRESVTSLHGNLEEVVFLHVFHEVVMLLLGNHLGKCQKSLLTRPQAYSIHSPAIFQWYFGLNKIYTSFSSSESCCIKSSISEILFIKSEHWEIR